VDEIGVNLTSEDAPFKWVSDPRHIEMEEQIGYDNLLRQRDLRRKNLREAALKEAERLSVLLKAGFDYEALYLVGSVAKGKGFRFQSDIDFVIKGLKKDLFLSALALLIKNSRFEIDLKPWEELSAESKAKVEKEGRILS
jgi:predicted nucleotidyltransferase